MKRCPQCNRTEADDALTFCRTDGTPLISDSASFSRDAGTAKFGSAPQLSEIETSVLPHRTAGETSRSTGPTTSLAAAQTLPTARELAKPKWRVQLVIALAVAIVIAISAAVLIFVDRSSYFAPLRTSAIESIAVLPFQNVSNDPNVEYLSDGITESLINSLTELQTLRVIARSTAFRYKGKDVDPQAVGRDLNVRAVLMGRVRQTGDNLDIQVDLVDAATGAQLWGEEYERKASEVVNIKQAIAREVTDKLRLKLSGEQQQQLAKRDTTNPEAYRAYLRGRFYWNKRTAETLKKAEEEYKHAIEMDPTYARPYGALAETYLIFPSYSVEAPVESYSKAKAAALQALEIDPTLVEAHAALAGAIMDLDWDLEGSNREYRRALELNPNYATAHHWYGEINLLIMGRPDEAIAHLKKAQELDPLSLIINADLGEVYINARQYDKAIDQLKKTISLEPNFHISHMLLGFAYTFTGSYEEAVTELQKARQLSEDPRVLGRLGYVYGRMGKKAEAFEVLEVLRGKSKEQYVSSHMFALVYTALGDKDKAFAELERSYQNHAPDCEYLTYEPAFDAIRDDPRFTDLVKRVGLGK